MASRDIAYTTWLVHGLLGVYFFSLYFFPSNPCTSSCDDGPVMGLLFLLIVVLPFLLWPTTFVIGLVASIISYFKWHDWPLPTIAILHLAFIISRFVFFNLSLESTDGLGKLASSSSILLDFELLLFTPIWWFIIGRKKIVATTTQSQNP
jgi:hypothetical protein